MIQICLDVFGSTVFSLPTRCLGPSRPGSLLCNTTAVPTSEGRAGGQRFGLSVGPDALGDNLSQPHRLIDVGAGGGSSGRYRGQNAANAEFDFV